MLHLVDYTGSKVSLVVGDYNNFGFTSWGSIDASSFTQGAYNWWTVTDANAIAEVVRGIFDYVNSLSSFWGIIEDNDLNNTAPSASEENRVEGTGSNFYKLRVYYK